MGRMGSSTVSKLTQVKSRFLRPRQGELSEGIAQLLGSDQRRQWGVNFAFGLLPHARPDVCIQDIGAFYGRNGIMHLSNPVTPGRTKGCNIFGAKCIVF